MKVWNESRQFEDKRFLFTVFAWKDIEIFLDAWEYENDSWVDEPKGQTFYEKYSSKDIIKALKKVVELVYSVFNTIWDIYRSSPPSSAKTPVPDSYEGSSKHRMAH